MDRYFTSIPFSEWLHAKKISVVGTLKENRIGIPKDIKDMKGRAEKSTIVIHNNDGNTGKVMISYVDNKKSGLKNILVLSTMHDVVKLSKDERKKPHVMVFYDKTKGVDVVDYISSYEKQAMDNERFCVFIGYSKDKCTYLVQRSSHAESIKLHFYVESWKGVSVSARSKATENFGNICLQPLFENCVMFSAFKIIPSLLQLQIDQIRVEDVTYAMKTSRTRQTTRENETS